MIGFLRGILLDKQAPDLLLDVNGVGYEMQAPMTTFYNLPETGSVISLYTHFVVREDAQQLYGFSDRETREVFRELIRVNGVGPKMALAILSALDAEALTHCIQGEHIQTLLRVPGVGRKTAERLLIELRDRVKRWSDKHTHSTEARSDYPSTTPAQAIQEDAEKALQSLGYKPQEAEKIIATILRDHQVNHAEDLIRLALKSMVTR